MNLWQWRCVRNVFAIMPLGELHSAKQICTIEIGPAVNHGTLC
jgi:hypothetical protein